MARSVTGRFDSPTFSGWAPATTGGAVYYDGTARRIIDDGSDLPYDFKVYGFNNARIIPVGNAEKPRGFGVLPCVYLAR